MRITAVLGLVTVAVARLSTTTDCATRPQEAYTAYTGSDSDSGGAITIPCPCDGLGYDQYLRCGKEDVCSRNSTALDGASSAWLARCYVGHEQTGLDLCGLQQVLGEYCDRGVVKRDRRRGSSSSGKSKTKKTTGIGFIDDEDEDTNRNDDEDDGGTSATATPTFITDLVSPVPFAIPATSTPTLATTITRPGLGFASPKNASTDAFVVRWKVLGPLAFVMGTMACL